VRIDIITLCPKIIEAASGEGILKQAIKKGLLGLFIHQLRDYARDKHRTVDDRPYGGGPGMVLKCEPIFDAMEAIGYDKEKDTVIFPSPSGLRFSQKMAAHLASQQRLIFICGQYEGVDQRVIDQLVDLEICIGDYILSNGTIATLVIIDSVVRLIPGVLGNENSVIDESFKDMLLEAPQYTRPRKFRDWEVPEVLLSGNHKAINLWKKRLAEEKTEKFRKDLWEAKKKETQYESD
jgi:tRNA (guanine37-N1)-methyltransferase